MLKVLFLCTSNSCRSQMAEGWTRRLHGDKFEAYSAGIDPAGLHPLAALVMKEAGVDISAQKSKNVRVLRRVAFDCVVTVCDRARENCPIFPGKTKMLHHDFEDPVLARGTEEERLEVFRRVRDHIKAFVAGLPEHLRNRRTS
jgi:arsenate reductase